MWLLAGCNKNPDDPTTDLFATYDRRGMLTSVRDNVIRPAYVDFATAAAALETSATRFQAAPDTAALRAVRQAWRTAVLAWAHAAPYDFGPAEAFSTAAGVAYAANATVIERAITPSAVIDAAYIENLGAPAKGLNALEYLLFSRAAGADPIPALFTTGANAAQRRAYLAALTTDVRAKADRVRQAWLTGTAPTQFVEADGNDVTSSLSLLTNALVRQTEQLKNTDLGLPLGDLNAGVVVPTAVPHYPSALSLAFIGAELGALEALYAGSRAGATPAPGPDDLLDHLGAGTNGQRLSQRITAQFAACRQKLAAIAAPLDVALVQNPAAVRDLYHETKQLTVLLKADMVSQLGVLLTFNDNDGD